MGRKKVFGITRYNQIRKTGKTDCPEENCSGQVKYIRNRIEPSYCEIFFEETFFYRCNANCRHHWKAIKNSLDENIIFEKY